MDTKTDVASEHGPNGAGAGISLEGVLPEGLGADRPVMIAATRYHQGGRTMYHAVVTLAALTTQLVVTRPDPTKPIPGGNRKVDAARARKFSTYLRNPNWVSPGIIVRAPSGEIHFTVAHAFPDGTAWGTLYIPLHVLLEILILDGQHRTLGTFYAQDELNARIAKLTDLLSAARRNGEDPAVVAQHTSQLQNARDQRDKLATEHISVDIAAVNQTEAKQMFGDINNNAKGVNPDYTTVLDQRDVVNRITLRVLGEHPLLEDRVELGQSTRMSVSNENLLGAKALADIVRALSVGTGRVGAKVQDELSRNEAAAVQKVRTFLDVLVSGFDDVREVMNGTLEPVELRRNSMLGSATMLRVLAAVFYEVTRPQTDGHTMPLSRAEVEAAFRRLAPKLREIPIEAGNHFWMDTKAFVPGANAPQARQGTIKALVNALVKWTRSQQRVD